MAGMVVPLAADKLEAWEAWVGELNGPRHAEFEDMNDRHSLTEHRAYLQPMPDGSYATLVVVEGPGADGFLPSIMGSDHEFDRWFVGSIGDLHGMDGSAPIPPMAQRRL
jgi:hypothetical protein